MKNTNLLRFYPGATPGKNRKQIENYNEKQKETGVWKKSSWQEIFLKMANRVGLVSF
jgi:hypothetical protein